MRAARAKGETYDPNPAAKPAESVEEDPDVKADPDLAKEIDEVEKPKPEETPAEKAARTRRHKEAAIKQRITKLAKARDAEKDRADRVERELHDLRSRQAPPPQQPSAQADTRPKPTLKDFPLEKFKDEDDPYIAQSAALAEAVSDWKWEQREAAAAQSRQREQADQDTARTVAAHDTRVTEAKARIPDYDAVVQAASYPRTPATPDLLDLVFKSDVSADMAYHLAKHGETTKRLLASPSRDALVLAFAEVQADVKAALKATKEPAAPHKVTAATEPAQPVTATAASGAVLRNPLQDAGTSIDLDEVRAFKRGRR